ncbi:citrate/2-methylcitrate synthase [Devosia sp.]|uniref:citrate/2-methylcitrate synthase n=1 Tax=Devosia sp. TaxID=1871048 RepID=UPI003A8E9A64
MWLTAREALARLGSKPQSLYASVSRGRIRARPDPADQRRSLYSAEDVERLAKRARGRRSSSAVAAETISWGEPVLATAITTIAGGRLYYRGQDAAVLAERMSFEDLAVLLLGALDAPAPQPEETGSVLERVAQLAGRMPACAGRPAVALRSDAETVLATICTGFAGEETAPVHARLAARWARPAAADIVRRALVLLADHELNASTFAARVAVSTGASLAAGALAGLATLSGPRHGGAAAEVRVLAEDIGGLGDDAAEAGLRDWLGEGRGVPGFGHQLYPQGDVRAQALLSHIALPDSYESLARAAFEVTGELPNIDFALAALQTVFDLPSEAPQTLFALGRSVGWLAHMLEQATKGDLIRPRARYVGPPPAIR